MIKILFLLLGSTIIFFPTVYAQTSTTTTTTTVTQPAYTVPEPIAPVPIIEIEGQYWMPKLTGHVSLTDNNQSTDVNLKSDLGLHDENGVPGSSILWNMGPESSIRATYLYLYYKGSNTLSRNIVFNGRTYPATSYINSKLIAQYFSLGWLWNFINMDNNRFKAGLVIDIKGVSTRTSLNAPAYGFSNSQNFTGAAPTPGLSLQYYLFKNISTFAEFDGLPAGHYGYFLDAQGGLKWDILHNLALSIGYRTVDVKVNYSDKDSGQLNLNGPFAALTLKF